MASLEASSRHTPLLMYEKGDLFPPSRWTQLEEGHCLFVQREGETSVAGEVDVVSSDGSVFWVWLDGGRGRIAVSADEEPLVWLPKGYNI